CRRSQAALVRLLRPYVTRQRRGGDILRIADATFTSWQCDRKRGRQSSASTRASRRADDSTSRPLLERRCPESRRSLGLSRCTESILHEFDWPSAATESSSSA